MSGLTSQHQVDMQRALRAQQLVHRRGIAIAGNEKARMNYTNTRNPTRHAAGIGFVVLLHVVLVYALVSGLANKVIEVVRRPIETKIIDAPKPPPPPPLPVIAPPLPPRVIAPPPPFIPPAEVPVQTPPHPNAIIAQSATPAPVEPAKAPAPAAIAAPATPAAPKTASVGVVCPNSTEVRASIRYPREAQRDGITGSVVIEFSVSMDGSVKDLTVTKSADPILDRAAENAVRQFKCVAQGQDVRVQVPFAFNLN
jgi:periplasmic protein TonB